MDINQVTLVGRLAENVTYFAGAGDKTSRAVARLIVNRPPSKNGTERKYDAIQIVGWGVHADNMAQYTSKGKELAIVGELRVNNVAPTTQGGEWKNYVEVQIRTLSFGRDSNNAKVMKALQGADATLVDAQAVLAQGGDSSFAAAALAMSPEIQKILESIVQQGITAPTADTPSEQEAEAEAEEEDVETPFADA